MTDTETVSSTTVVEYLPKRDVPPGVAESFDEVPGMVAVEHIIKSDHAHVKGSDAWAVEEDHDLWSTTEYHAKTEDGEVWDNWGRAKSHAEDLL
jgi:hypothetical protein